MAISLGRLRQYGAKKAEADRLAKEYAAQQKKAKSRGFFSNLLSKGGGTLLGGAIGGALGVVSGGLLMPLIMAGSNMLAKKGAHELTKGMAADPSKLTAKSEYGYGVEEAKTLREGLEQQISASDPWSQPGGFGKELLSSYLTAGFSGGLTGSAKTLLKGGKGSLGKALAGTESGKLLNPFAKGGLGRAWEGAGKSIGLDLSKDKKVYSPLHPEDITETPEYMGFPSEQEVSPILGPQIPSGTELAVDEWGDPMSEEIVGKEGGLVPKYNIGGMVQAQASTISDYFGMKGKTLGGSNTQSLSEMLGRV